MASKHPGGTGRVEKTESSLTFEDFFGIDIDEDSDAKTAAEWRAELGISSTSFGTRLRDAIAAGVMEYAGKSPRVGVSGVSAPVPVYRRVR